MGKKYDIKKEETQKKEQEEFDKQVEDIEDFLDNLNKVKELDEQNPLEQAIKYNAVKQNPPEQGYMEVRCFEDKDEKGNPIVVSESDHKDDKGLLVKKQFKHDPFYVIDLAKLFFADITACPSSVGPMLIDMSQKLVDLKKGAFKAEHRKSEFNWMWIVLIVILIIGIVSVVFMLFGGGGK